MPSFSAFFLEFLLVYGLRMSHLSPNSVISLAAFAHLCEAFVGAMPSIDIFWRLFKVSWTGGGDPVFSVQIMIRNKDVYIGHHPQLKIKKWRRQWFIMELKSVPRQLRFMRHCPEAIPEY